MLNYISEREFDIWSMGADNIEKKIINPFLDILKDKNVDKKIKKQLSNCLGGPDYRHVILKLYNCMISGKDFSLSFSIIKNLVKIPKIASIIANALNDTNAAKELGITFTTNNILKLFELQPFSNRSAGHGEIAFILLPFDSRFSNNDGGGDIKIKHNGIEYGIEIKCPGDTKVTNLANTTDAEKINPKISINNFTYYVNNIIKQFAIEYNIPLNEIAEFIDKNTRYSITPAPYKKFNSGRKSKNKPLHITYIIKQLGRIS